MAYIEPTPVVYESGLTGYNKEVNLLTSIDIDTHTNAEAPTTTEGVFADEVSTSCVAGVREFGADVPRGNAIDLPTGDPPTVGGVVKLKYGEGIDGYHLAYIQAILKTGFFVQERNFDKKGGYNERFIPFDDVHIVGFWSQ